MTRFHDNSYASKMFAASSSDRIFFPPTSRPAAKSRKASRLPLKVSVWCKLVILASTQTARTSPSGMSTVAAAKPASMGSSYGWHRKVRLFYDENE